jgi:signal transduction histidine kinase
LVGKNIYELVAPKDRDLVTRAFAERHDPERIRRLRYGMLRIDGQEHPAEASVNIVRDTDGSPLVCVAIIKDLTEEIEIQERLRRAERMAVIGETAAMVGHDLRNPMQGISGAVYVLRKKLRSTDDPETIGMLNLIDNGVDYADKIIKGLLDYSKEIQLELAESNAHVLINAAMQQVKSPINVRIQNLAGNTPNLLIDAAKMQRVFVNLMENAIDAMSAGGDLVITSSESNGFLEIRFSDSGEGIPEDVMRNLWKALKTTKAKGMGLGLAICKRIVEAHGGTIEAQSTPNVGSTFTIRLPIKHHTGTASGPEPGFSAPPNAQYA